MNIQIRHLIFRYGVFALLVMMSVGMLFFVCTFETRVKAQIHFFYDNHEHCWHGYLTRQEHIKFHPKDTLVVVQTSVGDIACIVESIVVESDMLHITLLPMKEETPSYTYIEGFIYVGRENIRDKILKKHMKQYI